MSAIFGILRFDGQVASAADLNRMGASMPYRSPDRRKIGITGSVGLGHGLMRVTHEDWNDAQPLLDKVAELTLVADARLDNREELAAKLGISTDALRDMADSALILAAYKHWGEDLVNHLLGDFAFAIWDGAARKLVLVRDHMGQRTLFYTRQADFYAFATDINALWAVEGVPRRISEATLGRYLMLMADGPEGSTMYDEIFGLTGGERMTLRSDGGMSTHRYWRPRADPVHKERDEAYYIATYRALALEAVACRLRRNLKPAALMISGGYDSALIAGLAGEVLRPQGRKLIGVSAVLPEGREDERQNARRWVEACQRHMPHLDVRYFVRNGKTPLTRIDEQLAATSTLPSETHFIRAALFDAAAAAGAQVIMDGHGGDYTINPRGFGALAYLMRTGRFHRAIRHAFAEARARQVSVWSVVKVAVRDLIPPTIVAATRWIARRGAPLWRAFLVNQDFGRRLFANGEIAARHLREHPIDRSRIRRIMLSVLNRQAGMSSAAVPITSAVRGLEFTMPFHDKRIVEFGLAVPEALYFKGGCDRFLAHKAVADVLPPELLSRRWDKNDTLDPDFMEMLNDMRDETLDLIDSMAPNENLKKYIDFDRVRLALKSNACSKRNTVLAYRAVLMGYFVRWFSGENS